MQLDYLDFDFSDEDSGAGSFDAMASVLPDRLPALLAEITGVLRWCRRAFGPAGEPSETGEWDQVLHAVAEGGKPVTVAWDGRGGDVTLGPHAAAARLTLTLTVAGSPLFCQAFREQFRVGD